MLEKSPRHWVDLFLLKAPRDTFWSALFIWDLLAGDERNSPLKRLSPDPSLTTDEVTVGDRQIPVDIHRSRVPSSAPAIVLCHGFAHQGNRDPRIIGICQRLARTGFVVLAPDFPLLKNYRLGLEDVDALVACVRHLQFLPEVDTERVGVTGFSFASSLIVIGLSRPEIRDCVSFGGLFGGYCDLRRTLRYVLTGVYEGEGHHGKVEPLCRQDRWKFLRGNVHLLPDSRSRDAYVAFLDKKIEDPSLTLDPILDSFTTPEQQALRLVENEDPARYDALFAPVARYFEDWLETLSLQRYAPGVRARMLIGHSIVDPVIPFTESMSLARCLAPETRPCVAIIGLFTHVDLNLNWRSPKSLVCDVMPDLRRLWGLIYRVIRA